MEYMENAMQGYLDNMERQREDVWDSAKEAAKDHLFTATSNAELLPKENGNPHQNGTWEHEEWEAAYEHYIMTGLGY